MAEHVPIKKRRFLFRSPSPPPKTPSLCPEETERLVKSQHAAGQGFHPNSMAKCQLAVSEAAASADLGQIVDSELNIQGRNLVKVNEQLCDNEDFSGISILAAAACSNSLGGDIDEGSRVEEFLGCEGPLQFQMNTESKADLVNSAEISTEGTGSCITTVPADEGAASLRTDKSPRKYLSLESIMEGKFLLENSVAGSQDLSSEKDDGKIGTQEFSARDDRLHWNLNTVMDAWEHPLDCQHADSPTNIADGICEYVDSAKHSDKNENSEGHESQWEAGGTDDNIGKALLPCELRRLAHETQVSNVEEDKLDACSDLDRAVSSQEKYLSCEINHAPNVMMDLVRKTESLSNHERISPNAGSVDSVPAKHASGLSPSASVNENASANCVYFHTTGNSENLSSHQVAGMDSSVDYSLAPESGHLTSTSFSEENRNAASTYISIVKSIDDCAANLQIGGTISSSSKREKQNVILPIVASTCEIGNVQNEDGGDAKRITGLHDDGLVINNMVGMGTGQPLGNEPLDDVKENAVFEPDEGGFSQSSYTNVEMPTLGAFPRSQPAVPLDKKVPHGEVTSVHDTAETDTQVHINAEEPATTSSGKSVAQLEPPSGLSSHDAHKHYSDNVVHSSSKVALEESLEDGYDSDVSQGDPGPVVGIEKASEHQVDYDSQYEDGELRESSVHTWGEYEGEDGETERLDYGSDNRDTNNLGSENTQDSNKSTKVTDAGSGRETDVRMNQAWLRVQNSEKVDSNGQGSGSGLDQVIRDDANHERQDNVKEPSQSANLKMKMSGWDRLPEHSTRIRDGSIRKNFTADHKDGLDSEDMETKVVVNRVYRNELLSRIEGLPSRGLFLRRDRLGIRESSSKSPSRSRTRFPYAQQSPIGRSGAGLAGNLGFRHRTRSPNFRSDVRMPRLRSPHLRPGFAADHVIGFISVPRNPGSPAPNSRWIGYKQCSSLLNRRSPGRIGPRGERFDVLDSPRKLKPNEYYRSVHPGRFTELNGGGRGGPRDEGTDDDRRKHGYRYRFVHSVKCHDMDGAVKRFRYDVEDGFAPGHDTRDKDATEFHGRGGPRDEGTDDDRRKHGYRYGFVHSVKRHDMDGAVKRFRYDVEDGFAPGHDTRDKDATEFHGRGNPKAYSRGIDTQIGDVQRRSREERGPFLHRRDEKYNANSKSFGMQEGDEDIGPRRRQPL